MDKKLTTGIHYLDETTQGGLGKDKLNIFLARQGVGKSNIIEQLMIIAKAISEAPSMTYEEILAQPDDSITHGNTIVQIVLYDMKYHTNLKNKIKRGHEFKGLYPHIHGTLHIEPITKQI